MRAVVDVVVVVDEPDAPHPLPRLLGPVRVRLVVEVAGESRPQVEEAAVRDGILVVVAVIRERDLPAQAAAAGVVVAARVGLRVEDGLRQRQPLRLVGRRVREVLLRRLHRRHRPEGLVVVAQGGCVVRGHVVLVGADLVQHRLRYLIVVGVVARVVPVVDHGSPHGAPFPPVIVAGRRRAW